AHAVRRRGRLARPGICPGVPRADARRLAGGAPGAALVVGLLDPGRMPLDGAIPGRAGAGGPRAARAALGLVPGPLGRWLGPADPGAVQPHRRAEGLDRAPGLVRAGTRRSLRQCSTALGPARGRGRLPRVDPAVRGALAT